MLSPFPGMDPYIEAHKIWSDFHGDLAGEIRASLNRKIRPNYFAALTSYVPPPALSDAEASWVGELLAHLRQTTKQ